MITSYSTLKTSIANFLHRDDLTSLIPEFITDGEARIYNDLRIKAMETAYSSTISSGTVALPTGFLEWKNLYVDSTPTQKLDRKSVEWIYQFYPTRSAEGLPKFFARDSENIIFAPYPDSNYAIKGTYYKRLSALSDSNTTNWFIENAPELLRYAALCEAAPYIRDMNMLAGWEQKYEMAKQRIKATDRREGFSGSVLTMRVG